MSRKRHANDTSLISTLADICFSSQINAFDWYSRKASWLNATQEHFHEIRVLSRVPLTASLAASLHFTQSYSNVWLISVKKRAPKYWLHILQLVTS